MMKQVSLQIQLSIALKVPGNILSSKYLYFEYDRKWTNIHPSLVVSNNSGDNNGFVGRTIYGIKSSAFAWHHISYLGLVMNRSFLL